MFNAFVLRRLTLVAAIGIALCGCDKKHDNGEAQNKPEPPEIVNPYSGESLMGIVRHAELVGFKRLKFEVRGGEGHRAGNPTDPNFRIFVGDHIWTTNVHVIVDPNAGEKTYVNFGYDSYGSHGNGNWPPDEIDYDRPSFLEIVVRDATTKKQWEAYIANIAEEISVGGIVSFAASANYCLAELREDFSDASYVATVRKKNVRIVVDVRAQAVSTPSYRWDCYLNKLTIIVPTSEEAERWHGQLGK